MGVGIWYTIIGDGSAITIDITNDAFDVEVAVASGACGGLTNVSCTDGGVTSESVTFASVTGTTYYIYVGDFATDGDDAGTFDIAVSCVAPPPGDECSDPLPYPGDVAAGTCVTGFDFTPFTDNGPSPTCDFGGDAVVWFSWTAPVITAAGDPIDLTFDDGDGQTNDCDIGIEAYETDCTTPASNCLSNVSGNLTGLIQGTDYLLLVYQDSPASAACDFCLSIACSAPTVTAATTCQVGDEGNFYVEVTFDDLGVGNTDYTVDIAGPQTNVTASGSYLYGPFPSGTPVDVVITGVTDPACGFTVTGLDKDCSCPADLALTGLADGDDFCSTDAAVPLTYAPVAPFTSSVTITNTADGSFDGEVGFGLYSGAWDDGTALGLPPAGTGLFGTDSEASLEAATPNDGTGNPDVTTAGNFGGDPLVPGFSQTVSGLAPGTYTIYLVDDFGDGWNGTEAIVTDECGNTITTQEIIEAISADTQDEVAWVNFTLPLQAPVILVSGPGVVQTADPDGIANNGDETYEFDPSMVAATACGTPESPVITLTTDFCGVMCEATLTPDVYFVPVLDTDFALPTMTCGGTPITDVCGAGLTVTYDGAATPPTLNPGDADITVAYTVAFTGAPAGCEATGTYMVTCPSANCPTSDFSPPFAPEYFCDMGVPTYPMAGGAQFTITDPDGTQLGGIVWFDGVDPTADAMVDVSLAVSHSGIDPCASEPYTYYAFVQCDADLDGAFDLASGDSWVQVATHSFEIYPIPDVTNAAGGACTDAVTDNCGSYDILYSTDNFATAGTAMAPMLNPGDPDVTVNWIASDPAANVTCEATGSYMLTCPPLPGCTLVLSPETVVCDANTAGADTYTVTIPFDNGAEGEPGGGNYTITTTGTIGGDNPMVTATGSITITFTEGTDYSYQIQGVAGSGANETCDLTVMGISPTCDPASACTLILSPEVVACDANTAGTDTYTVTIPFDNGAEGEPGGGNYTITTTGTIGGDNPMVTPTGSITVTFTEGTGYSYQIQGVAGSGANETCDLTVMGASPTCDPCEDEITYAVSALGCDMTGATIELQDAAGAPIASMPLGPDGGAGTFGLQPCGMYQILITGAPACYTDEGGDVGPRTFSTDGSGPVAQTFSIGGPMDIPTLSQWGLITLALLLMSFGSVKMAVAMLL